MSMLTKESWVRLSSALSDAIQQEDDFVEIARRLHWRPSDVIRFHTTGRGIIQAFIERAEVQSQVPALLAAACEVSEGNQMLAVITNDDLVFIEPAPPAGASATEEQRDQIANLLSSIFSDSELASIIRAAQPDRSKAWEDGPPTKASIGRYVDAAAEESWFLALLREAIRRAGTNTALASLAAKVAGPVVATSPAAEEAWKQALERRMLSGGYFMINRAKLRSSMGLMLPTVGNRILLVRGDEKTGLSHSVRLVMYISEVCPGLTAAVVDLEEASRFVGPGQSLSPRHLAREIISELKYDMSLPPDPSVRQWAAWNVEFARAFARRADDDPRRVFLVLDRLHKVRLTRATTDFVEVLSTYIGTKVPAFRLVLVGYGGDLPDGVRQARLVDETSALTKADLVEFFAKAYEEANVEIDLPQLTRKVRTVLKGQRSYPPGSLLDLSDRVQSELPGMPA